MPATLLHVASSSPIHHTNGSRVLMRMRQRLTRRRPRTKHAVAAAASNVRYRTIADLGRTCQLSFVSACKAKLAAVAAALGASGCSFAYDIYAVFDGTRLLLNTHAKESRYRAGLCLDALDVREAGTTVWRIERDPPRPDTACPNDFPIAYGSLPRGFRATTPPAPLRPNVVYHVTGHGNASFEGSFRYWVRKATTVQNLPPPAWMRQ
jgi:hypothetical protein